MAGYNSKYSIGQLQAIYDYTMKLIPQYYLTNELGSRWYSDCQSSASNLKDSCINRINDYQLNIDRATEYSKTGGEADILSLAAGNAIINQLNDHTMSYIYDYEEISSN